MRSLEAQHLEMFVAFECFAELPHGWHSSTIKIHLDKDRPFAKFGWLVIPRIRKIDRCHYHTPPVSINKMQTATKRTLLLIKKVPRVGYSVWMHWYTCCAFERSATWCSWTCMGFPIIFSAKYFAPDDGGWTSGIRKKPKGTQVSLSTTGRRYT